VCASVLDDVVSACGVVAAEQATCVAIVLLCLPCSQRASHAQGSAYLVGCHARLQHHMGCYRATRHAAGLRRGQQPPTDSQRRWLQGKVHCTQCRASCQIRCLSKSPSLRRCWTWAQALTNRRSKQGELPSHAKHEESRVQNNER
jgi:hypothetical protein